MSEKRVWTIAGSDSSGGAGIQADLSVFQALSVSAGSIITAVTAQNNQQILDSLYIDITAQLKALSTEIPAAIKLGMIGKISTLHLLKEFLKNYSGRVVLDPVLYTSSGGKLFLEEAYIANLKDLFPYVTMLTPNIAEAEWLLNRKITSYKEVEIAAKDLLALLSIETFSSPRRRDYEPTKSILIKGGHLSDALFSQDYWTDGNDSFWLSSERQAVTKRGTGCTLSSALAAFLTLNYSVREAVVLAKMFLNQTLVSPINNYSAYRENNNNLPYITQKPLFNQSSSFPDCGPDKIGLYPIVDTVVWVKQLLERGVSTIQLRIKNKSTVDLTKEIQEAVFLAKQYQARLFINDNWEIAINVGAYGVHLGQEDLKTANIEKIKAAGLRLGVSTHSYEELARAHAYHPSYVALGPIFATTSKKMEFAPQGIDKLKEWCAISPYPVVAIGGINESNLSEVLSTGASGAAMIAAVPSIFIERGAYVDAE